ncbi:MAG: hypothetical protein HPY66_1661 [Firmicutes bacterium]|nr:hypothetical protein [Bacillota bacterium]
MTMRQVQEMLSKVIDWANARLRVNAQMAGSDPKVVTVTISSGQTVSNAINCEGRRIVQIIMPDAWTAATLSFQTATASDGTFGDLQDDSGAAIALTVAANQHIAIAVNALVLSDLMCVKLKSSAAQEAERVITLVLA